MLFLLSLTAVGVVLYYSSRVVFWDGSAKCTVYIHIVDYNGFPAAKAQVTLSTDKPETKLCDLNGNCEFEAWFKAGGQTKFLNRHTGTFYLGPTKVLVKNCTPTFDGFLSDLAGQSTYPLEIRKIDIRIKLEKPFPK
jgi:hypothetical protein